MVPERGMLAAVEHIAERLAACEKRQEAERLLELLGRMGDDAVAHLRNILTTRPAAEAVLSVAPLSRLDMVFLSQELPPRISAWGRAAQDALVRQLGIGGAVSRGSLLTLLLPVLDPLIMALAIDEIGISGDGEASPALLQLAQGKGPGGASDFLRLKAIEALGRLREMRAADVLEKVVSDRVLLGFKEPRELRIAAAQALRRIDAGRAQKVVATSGLRPDELKFAPLEVVAGNDWTRSRRHPRVAPRALNAVARSNRGSIKVTLTGLSLCGGVAIRDAGAPVAYEAVLELPSGLRRIHGQVLVRENRPREVTFEFVNLDLDDLTKLRRILNAEAAGAPAASPTTP